MSPDAPRRVALITGAARGIGRAIAMDFAADHDVAITHRTSDPSGLPDTILTLHADFADTTCFERVIDTTLRRYGRLDVIVNNAGAISTSALDAFDAEAHRHLLDVNLLAPHGLLAAALPHLKDGAAIVNISSVNAVLPPKDAVLYGASKAALDLWTRGMAKDLGPRGIRVNAVAPGAVNTDDAPRDAALTQLFTDMTALGRLATAQDIASAVRYLASDAASAITGEVLTVSGGYRL